MAQDQLSYLGNVNVKRDGIEHTFTDWQFKEMQKCMFDPAYFARAYCKIISLDHGLVNFDLYPYQEKMFKQWNSNRFNIVLACRQSGKSIASVAYLLWYALFQPEKTIMILANKGQTAREMLARVTLMLENIPFFLQPGCKALNRGNIDFSNNSRIIAASTSAASVRGFSVHLLYLDELAFVNDATTFYTSTYPIITGGQTSKVIITSTANGVGNLFFDLWEGAMQKTNDFTPIRVDWWDVPGRDEKWKEATIRNTSQLQFDQEFGNTFVGTGDTLIHGSALLDQRAQDPIETLEHGNLFIYKEPVKDHEYILAADTSEGISSDYSTFNIIDISMKPFEQAAVYRNDRISPLLFPDIIYKYATLYNEAYVLIESNNQGMLVCNGLYNDLEYENVHLESAIKADKIGIMMTKKSKRIGCSGFKDLIESRKLKIYDKETIREMSTFVAKGTSYQASQGNHDDLVMNLILFGYFSMTDEFRQKTDIDIRQLMYNKRMQEIEDDVPPFGFIDNGVPEEDFQKEFGPQWSLVREFDHEYGY